MCVNCSKRIETQALDAKCTSCKSALLLESNGEIKNLRALNKSEIETLPPGVWRYRALLPNIADGNIVTLGEGATPLLQAKRLGSELGLDNLLIKDETRNPTGSFMDRGSTVLVSLAKEQGVNKISCTTTGNLGASVAAYSARAGIEAEVGIQPNTDHGKLYQMIAYGARVEILSKTHARRYYSELGTLSVSAANPFILEGEKTTGFEIIQDMDWSCPDAIVLPVGTGGHLTMIWRGLLELHKTGLIDKPTCKLIGVQLQSSAQIVGSLQRANWRAGLGDKEEEEGPQTELEESDPFFKKTAVKSIRDSKGHGVEVSAREAIQGTSLLARTEGIFAEPSSTSIVAALRIMKEDGLVDRSDRIVCVVTGAGLKDTRAIKKIARTPEHVVTREHLMITPLQIGATKLKVMRALGDGPRFGYDLWKSISKERKITTTSIYQHLSELEGIALIRRSGRVTTIKGRERIFYELTKKGGGFLNTVGKPRQSDRFVVD